MGKNMIKSFLEQERDTESTQVADFFPKMLNGLADAIADGQKTSMAELVQQAAGAVDYSGRGLRAKFIVCATSEFFKKYSLTFAQNFALRMEHGLRLYFSKFLGIKTDFSVYYCSKPAEGAEALAFEVFEDIKANKVLENEIQRADSIFKARTTTGVKDRGLKILVLQPDNGQHSRAEQNGMFAYLNINHLSSYSSDAIINKESYDYFDITLVHEVCHLFGLSDRYQFVQHYTQIAEKCYSIQGGADLVPIAVDPAIDPDAITQDMALNNLMFGKDDWCRALTNYQKDVILGIAGKNKDVEMEPSYDQMTVFLPVNGSLRTAGTYIKRTAYEDIANDNTLILGANTSGGVFTYIKRDGKFDQDYSGSNLFLNGTVVGDGFNAQVGMIVRDAEGNILPSSNALGLQILNSPDCNDPKLKKENDKNFKQGSGGN